VVLKGLLEEMTGMCVKYGTAQDSNRGLSIVTTHAPRDLWSDICVRLVCVGGTCMTAEGRELCIHWWWKRMYWRWLQMSFHLHLLI